MTTPSEIIAAAQARSAGWLDLVVENWNELFATEKQLIFAIIQATSGNVLMTVNAGYVTFTDGTNTVDVPSVSVS